MEISLPEQMQLHNTFFNVDFNSSNIVKIDSPQDSIDARMRFLVNGREDEDSLFYQYNIDSTNIKISNTGHYKKLGDLTFSMGSLSCKGFTKTCDRGDTGCSSSIDLLCEGSLTDKYYSYNGTSLRDRDFTAYASDVLYRNEKTFTHVMDRNYTLSCCLDLKIDDMKEFEDAEYIDRDSLLDVELYCEATEINSSAFRNLLNFTPLQILNSPFSKVLLNLTPLFLDFLCTVYFSNKSHTENILENTDPLSEGCTDPGEFTPKISWFASSNYDDF